ncbi:MAG: porin family protein [Dysgonomonas sp.]
MKTVSKKMIKNISIVCLFFLFSVSTASSQIRFGLKAGVDVASPKLSSDILKTKNNFGFQIGPTMEVGIPFIGLSLDGSLMYGYKNYHADSKVEDAAKMSNYSYLTIPLNLKKRFGLFGLAGIYISGGAYADIRISGGELKYLDEKFKSKDFGTGLSAGAGVYVLKKLELGMNFRYRLTDNFSSKGQGDVEYISEKHEKTWNVGLTYFF